MPTLTAIPFLLRHPRSYRHPREGGDLEMVARYKIPAFAGMTEKRGDARCLRGNEGIRKMMLDSRLSRSTTTFSG